MVVKKFPNRFILFSFVLTFCMLFLTLNASAGIEEHITRTESGFYYTVQKGDTLWDLSREFSNSPWTWPEMWHYNPQIKNPHLIYPGQKILIFKKEWEGAEKKPEPVVQKPVEKVQAFYSYKKIANVGFIRQEAVDPLGTIFKSQNDPPMIDTGSLVYINPEPGAPALSVGNKYTIYRTFDRIKDPATDKYIGVQHFLTGTVEITSVEPEYVTGKVLNSYRNIELNDHLMAYEERDANIPIKESKPGVSGTIIKAEKDYPLIAQHSIIFFDKGENDGIEPGQFYSIYLQESARPDPEKIRSIKLEPYHIGELIVLRTEKTTSTALITNSIQQILPGSLVRTLEVTGK